MKFLESGHSFLPNDSYFSDIEKHLKYHPDVFVPQQWYDIIKEARSGSKPFIATNMSTEEFLSTTPLENAVTRRKVATDGQKVKWLEMRQIQVHQVGVF